MDMEEDTVKQLAELAFIAGGYGMLEQSDALVAGLAVVRPDSAQPYLIQAMTRLNAKDALGAEQLLRSRALQIEPDSSMAKALLGLALHMQGRSSERDRCLKEVMAVRDDKQAVEIAATLTGRSETVNTVGSDSPQLWR